MIKGITLKICMLCFVLINSVLLNLLHVWVFARIGYETEGARFISVQLSTDAVSALQKVWVLITLEVPMPQVKNKFHLNSNDFG